MRGIPVTDQDGNRIGESKVAFCDCLKLNEFLVIFLKLNWLFYFFLQYYEHLLTKFLILNSFFL